MNSLSSMRMGWLRPVQSNITRRDSYGQIGLFTGIIRSKVEGRICLFKARPIYKEPKAATVDSRDAVAMSTTSSAAGTRLKREDYRWTKHDSAFSEWKLLIAASDWKDYAMGKEGAEKYRTQNLPNCVSCTGIYELGIATRDSRKLDPNSVIPAYLGQSENVRTRLQQYGRDGAHLENGCPRDEFTNYQSFPSHEGPGLFSGIFSRGGGIAYRFAPMKSKQDAEMTEIQLLDKFDYAWNKDRNGARREDDILKALGRAKASLFSLLAKKLLFTHQKQVGIKIRSCEPLPLKNGSNSPNSGNIFSFSKTLRIKRLQPVPVQHGYGDYSTEICGVAIGQGSICTKSPVKGRKRCAEHKGMRVNGYTLKFNSTPSVPVSMGSGIISNQDSADSQNRRLSHGTSTDQTPYTSDQSSAPICGVTISHESVCTMPPVKGRKRCAAHKGMRVNGNISKSNTVGKEPSFLASVDSGD